MLISGSLLVMGISAISWHGFRENQRNFFRNNLAQYGAYLVRDLEENLNLEHARELSQRLFLIIRYEGENETWETGSGIPPLQKIHFRKWMGKSSDPGFRLLDNRFPTCNRFAFWALSQTKCGDR